MFYPLRAITTRVRPLKRAASHKMLSRKLPLLFIGLLTDYVSAHVPTYSDNALCSQSCCHVPHVHTTSQAVYVKGTGGLEIEIEDLKTEAEGEIIDFDVVFKYKYDQTTYDLYVGCGGCVSPGKVDPLRIPPYRPKPAYQSGKLESFTQTGYFPLLPSGPARQYDTTKLRTENCSDNHWSIRVVDYNNRTTEGHETLFWGAVVGCEGFDCEIFTFIELLSFPIYVLRNHGEVWNELPWTLIPIGIGVFVFMALLAAYLACYRNFYILFMRKTEGKYVLSARAVLYFFAVWSLFSDLIEIFTHFLFTAVRVGSEDSRGYGIFFGIVFTCGKVVPIVLVCLIWHWLNTIPETDWREKSNCRGLCCGCPGPCCGKRTGLGFYSPIWAHGSWSIIELPFIGLAGFVWLGGGFFVFPVAVTLAATIRLYVWLSGWQKRRIYNRVEPAADDNAESSSTSQSYSSVPKMSLPSLNIAT